jgi:hypothetical protein
MCYLVGAFIQFTVAKTLSAANNRDSIGIARNLLFE